MIVRRYRVVVDLTEGEYGEQRSPTEMDPERHPPLLK